MSDDKFDVRGDTTLPEDDAIAAAHPLKTGKHNLYEEARRFVSARHSKAGLIELVNWLLFRIDGLSGGQAVEERYRCVKCGVNIPTREVAPATVKINPITGVRTILRFPPGGPTCANITACLERAVQRP